MLSSVHRIVEVPANLAKTICVIPTDQWGKPRGRLHKALAKVAEKAIKSFETDCIEGWIECGGARAYESDEHFVIFMLVQAEPGDAIIRHHWHRSCVDLLYNLRGAAVPLTNITVAFPDRKLFDSALWAEDVLLACIDQGVAGRTTNVILVDEG